MKKLLTMVLLLMSASIVRGSISNADKSDMNAQLKIISSIPWNTSTDKAKLNEAKNKFNTYYVKYQNESVQEWKNYFVTYFDILNSQGGTYLNFDLLVYFKDLAKNNNISGFYTLGFAGTSGLRYTQWEHGRKV